MTPADFRDALKALGLTQRRLAETLGVDAHTVSRWAKGHLPVPQYAVAYLDLLRAKTVFYIKAVDGTLPQSFAPEIIWTEIK